MNIVIMGCGKVGLELASTLTGDGHSVAVIDKQQKALDQVSEELDVLTILGDGADTEVLRQAGIEEADIFIAVSPSDELNMLVCLVVGQIAKAETIARVRNPVYYREGGASPEQLGVKKAVNPERLAARDIYALLIYPALSRVDFFAERQGVVFTLHCRPEYGFTGRSLMDVRKETHSRVLACAVHRKDEVFVPGGSFVIEPDDEVTFVTSRADLPEFLAEHGIKNEPADDILITGGGAISYYLTEILLEKKKNVRIVELNDQRCELLAEAFPAAEVIHGDGTDRRFLEKQGLCNADAFVALTGIDEENIITANFAKNRAGIKVITKVNRTDLRDVIEALDIDSAVFPKVVCADAIAQYVRARKSGAENRLEAFFRYMGKLVEITEIMALPGDPGLSVPLKDLKLKKDLILASIEHDGKLYIPSGMSTIEAGDSVVVATKHKGISSIKDILRL